jgi:hypothetical protein
MPNLRARLAFLLIALLLWRHAAAGTVALTVIRDDWHTSLAIPLSAVPTPLAAAVHARQGDDTLIIGFGARVWMGKPNRGVEDAIDALTGSPGAIQILSEVGLPPGDADSSETLALEVPAEAIDAIAAFAWSAIAKPPDGRIAPYAEPTPGNRYYDSSVHYGMLHNCNSWTAEALQRAGLPVSPDGILRAGSLMSAVREAMATRR